MLQYISRDLRLHGRQTLLSLLFYVVFALLGILMVLLVMNLDSTAEDWFCMGTLFCLVTTFAMSMYYGIVMRQTLMLALTMGRTRREALICMVVRLTLVLLAGYAFTRLVYTLETTLYPALFPHLPNVADLGFVTAWWLPLVLIPGAIVLTLFICALNCRYGQKATQILYFGGMGVYLLLQMLLSRAPRILHSMLILTPQFWIGLGAAVLAALLAAAWLLLRRVAYRD